MSKSNKEKLMTNKKKAYYEVSVQGKVLGKVPLKGGKTFDKKHKYFRETSKFRNSNKALVIWHMLDEYGHKLKLSRKEWKKTRKPYRFEFTNKEGLKWKSKPMNFSRLDDHIKKFKRFNFSDFDFPTYNCFWLDTSIDLTLNFHVIGSPTSGMFVQDWTLIQRFGHNLNLKPQIDREGHLISSFLPGLTKRIIKQRNDLINSSDQALDINWLFGLKELIINSISLVDITLLQLYTKAEFSPESSWVFDKKKLGEKHARRISDKIKWVRQISGVDPKFSNEIKSLMILKNIRNHLSHFDPPCFAASLEEIAEWLNMIVDIGTINYKIRNALKVKLSEELMTLMVQPMVEFVPQSIFENRVDQNLNHSGYKTSIWPPKKKERKPQLSKWKIKSIMILRKLINKIESTSS